MFSVFTVKATHYDTTCNIPKCQRSALLLLCGMAKGQEFGGMANQEHQDTSSRFRNKAGRRLQLPSTIGSNGTTTRQRACTSTPTSTVARATPKRQARHPNLRFPNHPTCHHSRSHPSVCPPCLCALVVPASLAPSCERCQL